MIISCPSCKLKFKVNTNKIPAHGRMVQCSKCLHKWKETGQEKASFNLGKIMFIIVMLLISFLIIFIGSFIIFGNQVPMPNFLLLWLENIEIPV